MSKIRITGDGFHYKIGKLQSENHRWGPVINEFYGENPKSNHQIDELQSETDDFHHENKISTFLLLIF